MTRLLMKPPRSSFFDRKGAILVPLSAMVMRMSMGDGVGGQAKVAASFGGLPERMRQDLNQAIRLSGIHDPHTSRFPMPAASASLTVIASATCDRTSLRPLGLDFFIFLAYTLSSVIMFLAVDQPT
jgi:hypothetical protein